MVSVAAFGPGIPGSNLGWFAVSKSNQKLSFQEYYKYCNPVMGGTLVGYDKKPLKANDDFIVLAS